MCAHLTPSKKARMNAITCIENDTMLPNNHNNYFNSWLPDITSIVMNLVSKKTTL
jgi:hypothetical protein